MTYEIRTFHTSPCALEVFTINGITANVDDFVETVIGNFGSCMDNECSHEVEGIEPTDEVLNRYHITVDEYCEIVNELRCALYVTDCGWCS